MLAPIWNVTLCETYCAQREGKSENKSCLTGFWVRASAAKLSGDFFWAYDKIRSPAVYPSERSLALSSESYPLMGNWLLHSDYSVYYILCLMSYLHFDAGLNLSACLALGQGASSAAEASQGHHNPDLSSTQGLVINFTCGVGVRSRVPWPSTSSSAADFDKQACFNRGLFLMFLPPRLFAWFLFIRPGLLGRGNDSSKTPTEESDIVSKSHRLTPGYYWIRLCSLVAPLLPAWGSSRESEAKVTIQPNKGTSLKEHHDVGNSHLLSRSKTNLGTKHALYWKEKDVWLVMWPSNEPLEYDKIEGKALENIDTKIFKYVH